MFSRCNTFITYKMINFHDYTNEYKTEHNLKWQLIPHYPYRISITGGSGSGKKNASLSLINNEPDIHKHYLPVLYLINKKH